MPLLAPGSSWVIQGRCCGMLTLLIRHELRTHVSLNQGVVLAAGRMVLAAGCRVAFRGRVRYQTPPCTVKPGGRDMVGVSTPAQSVPATPFVTQDPVQQDGLRQGVRWQLLDGGAISSLTSLLHSTSKVPSGRPA